MALQPIGIIHSPHQQPQDCPIQPAQAAQARGRVEILAAYEAGLQCSATIR